MEWFAIASYGAYPTPTPTDAQRAIYAVSYGLLATAPEGDSAYWTGLHLYLYTEIL
jgi:hypothetical protein